MEDFKKTGERRSFLKALVGLAGSGLFLLVGQAPKAWARHFTPLSDGQVKYPGVLVACANELDCNRPGVGKCSDHLGPCENEGLLCTDYSGPCNQEVACPNNYSNVPCQRTDEYTPSCPDHDVCPGLAENSS